MSSDDLIVKAITHSISTGFELPSELNIDGCFHRYNADKSCSGNKNDEFYIGNFVKDHLLITYGTFKNGHTKHSYRSWSDSDLTPEQLKEFREEQQEHQEKVTKAIEEKHKDSAEKSKIIWDQSTTCTTHPYLERKQIQANGARLYKNNLVIPVYDSETDNLMSLQFISEDGTKRFLKGGKTSGGYFQVGEGAADFIGEGFATSGTVHEITQKPTINAFSASNCIKVALHLKKRNKFETIRLLQDLGDAGDKVADQWSEFSVGDVCKPDWLLNERNNKSTDWNDLAKDLGKEEVVKQLSPRTFKTFSLCELLASDDEPESWSIDNLFTKGSINIIHARGGVGKSLLATDFGICCSAGLEVMNGWNCKKQRVLVVDGELPAPTIKLRWNMAVERWGACQDLDMTDIEILPWLKIQHDSSVDMNLFCPISRKYLDASIEKADFIILDNFDALTQRSGEEDFRGDELNWSLFFKWARKWSSLGKTFCIVMHSTKGSSLAGSRRISGDAYTIIRLDPLKDELKKNPNNTAFVVTIPKGRSIEEQYKKAFAVEMLKPNGFETYETPWLRHSLEEMALFAEANKGVIRTNGLENFIKQIY